MKKWTWQKIDRAAYMLIFCLAIYIPLLIGLVQDNEASSTLENRALSKRPPLPTTSKSLQTYPDAFNAYYADHFGGREWLSKMYFRTVHARRARASDDVTVGLDGWLFLGGIKPHYQEYEDPIGDAINANQFTADELEAFAQSLTAVDRWLGKRGIEYIYVIAPNKHSIYFEKLPTYLIKQHKRSATDQLVDYLRQHTEVTVIDLRSVLLSERKKHAVYFKSDTHWNQYGANAAQFAIMQAVASLFPGQVAPTLLSDREFRLEETSGDLADFSKLENFREDMPIPIFEEGCMPTQPSTFEQMIRPHTLTCNTKTLNTVIFRDSFFTGLQPYISRQFYHSTYIWERMNPASLVEYVDKASPDIVIDEVVERALPYVPKPSSYAELNKLSK